MLAKTLSKYIENAENHLTTGFIGTRFVFDVLAEYGYEALAYKVLTADTFPSWLHMLSSGATAITESWLGEADPDASLSMSHFSLGSVVAWFFEYLGGIRINESAPGLAHIVLKPVMIKEIGSFAVRYQSKYGEIYTEWHFEGDRPIFTYRVPQNVSVTVIR
jgi:alpha-L-rhamnosidase